MERSDELSYLKFVLSRIHLGPAHTDVMKGIKADFIQETQKLPPRAYFGYIWVGDREILSDECTESEIWQWVRNQG